MSFLESFIQGSSFLAGQRGGRDGYCGFCDKLALTYQGPAGVAISGQAWAASQALQGRSTGEAACSTRLPVLGVQDAALSHYHLPLP